MAEKIIEGPPSYTVINTISGDKFLEDVSYAEWIKWYEANRNRIKITKTNRAPSRYVTHVTVYFKEK